MRGERLHLYVMEPADAKCHERVITQDEIASRVHFACHQPCVQREAKGLAFLCGTLVRANMCVVKRRPHTKEVDYQLVVVDVRRDVHLGSALTTQTEPPRIRWQAIAQDFQSGWLQCLVRRSAPLTGRSDAQELSRNCALRRSPFG